jgi:hypothetical protein
MKLLYLTKESRSNSLSIIFLIHLSVFSPPVELLFRQVVFSLHVFVSHFIIRLDYKGYMSFWTQ